MLERPYYVWIESIEALGSELLGGYVIHFRSVLGDRLTLPVVPSAHPSLYELPISTFLQHYTPSDPPAYRTRVRVAPLFPEDPLEVPEGEEGIEVVLVPDEAPLPEPRTRFERDPLV